MRVHEVWIRFYKSFNFDYELKASPGSTPQPWQVTPDGWMPHVRIPVEPAITAVVGANESGKTHLLDAIRTALTGDGLFQRDFCRYSPLFSVEQGARLYPEVGATVRPDTPPEAAEIDEMGIPRLRNGDVLFLRGGPEITAAVDSDGCRQILSAGQAEALQRLLPHPHELQTDIPLPDSVSIAALAQNERGLTGRKRRARLWALLSTITSAGDLASNAAGLIEMLTESERASEAEQLGVDLLTKVARIELSSFSELQNAIAEEREGLVNGLIQEMNNSIARHLNISRWWTQDPEFQLRVSPREHELVFTIRDRTGTDYSFTERSRGLRYFLSYYVQLLSHDRPDAKVEILLMDEPDAYLSASGQQDLLRVLEHHARPDDSSREDQVVYVTHSPFLINRNAGYRVRVVDKGSRDEGTRLVKDATRNHYEPLRSSLGSFVAETAFIGGDNLFVEGISDQVLLAEMNARLLRMETAPSQCLDLNQATIVQGGSNIPYLLYLARGRDQIKPACAVLLDGDTAGKTMRNQIRRGGAHGKPTVPDDLVVMISEWAASAGIQVTSGVSVREPEDLIPAGVAIAAARRYARTFLGCDEDATKKLTERALTDRLAAKDGSLWDALAEAFEEVFETQLGKAGFAKELIAHVSESEGRQRPTGVPALDDNFAKLIRRLSEVLSLAREREEEARRGQRLERIIDAFGADYPTGCTRDRAAITLRRIDGVVEDTAAGDAIRASTARMRRDFKLTTEPMKNLNDHPAFLDQLRSLRHLERLTYQGVVS